MSYEVTATRKRPQLFDELTGQEFVVSTLKNSIQAGRIAHAYLFSGPRGVGKTSAARLLAKALNCEKGPAENPCGTCPACIEIARGNSLDVIEIDGASNTSVNDVREIKDEVLFAPNSSRYKVYIIDEVHMLSNSAFNALLKTIEEPPPYIVFIFATTEIHKVPATIRSRCQQFHFRLISPDLITEKLREVCGEMSIEAEEDALLWIAKEATGSLRDAYTLFDQVASFSNGKITMADISEKLGLTGFDRIHQLVELLSRGKSMESIDMVDSILADGVSAEQFVTDMTDFFRNLLLLQCGVRRQSVLGINPERYSPELVQAFSSDQLEYAVQMFLSFYKNIRYSLNQRYELELLVSRLSVLKKYIPYTSLIEQVGALQKKFLREFSDGTEPQPGPDGTPSPEKSGEAGVGTTEETSFTSGTSATYNAGSDAAEEAPGDTQSMTESSAGTGNFPWDELISGLKKTKVALTSALSKVSRWSLDDDTLSIYFTNAFFAASVREEMMEITKRVEQLAGRKISVQIHIEKEEEKERKEKILDEQVEMVKKVFKGEIIQGG